MYYLTCIDSYSGVYQSQVIDVINFLNGLNGGNTKLISIVPIQNYRDHKKKIKSNYSNSIVLPFLLGITNWRFAHLFMFFLNKKKPIICRGPIATKLALGRFDNVVYDGRAAAKAEVEEYDVVGGDKKLGIDFINAEKEAVLKSKYRIAVSNHLVKYWEQEFGYKGNDFVVIPCTLSSQSNAKLNSVNSDTIKIVYSGGVGPWQSFPKVIKLLENCLNDQKSVEVVFLTQENEYVTKLIQQFPNRCERKWLKHNEVAKELERCDYGVLIRDNKVTNQVASPVKFAEYLNAGLAVLISNQIGDFSKFVETNNCGVLIGDSIPTLEKLTNSSKQKNKELCKVNFIKESSKIQELYIKLLKQVGV